MRLLLFVGVCTNGFVELLSGLFFPFISAVLGFPHYGLEFVLKVSGVEGRCASRLIMILAPETNAKFRAAASVPPTLANRNPFIDCRGTMTPVVCCRSRARPAKPHTPTPSTTAAAPSKIIRTVDRRIGACA